MITDLRLTKIQANSDDDMQKIIDAISELTGKTFAVETSYTRGKKVVFYIWLPTKQSFEVQRLFDGSK